MLDVSPTTLRRWADSGDIPFIKTTGGHRRYQLSYIKEMLAEDSVSIGEAALVLDWARMLKESSVHEVCEAILDLKPSYGDWFLAADFLGRVTKEIGRCWADGDFSVAEEHLATGKLTQSLTLIAADFVVADDAPMACLATLSNEHHTLGLSLASFCIRSAACDVQWLGANMPIEELSRFLAESTTIPSLLMLSASEWSTDRVMLERACRELGTSCKSHGTALLIGGSGHWPDRLSYGKRCRSFADLKHALGKLDLLERDRHDE